MGLRPSFVESNVSDAAHFAAARNKVTVLHSNGLDTLSAMAMICEGTASPEQREWCEVFQYGYNAKAQKIYSIQYHRDPAVAKWLDCIEADLALHRYLQATFSFMAMGLRTNRVMAAALAL